MTRTVRGLVLGLLVLSTSGRAFAWHDTGHMLVAQIAYSRLTPAAKARHSTMITTSQRGRGIDPYSKHDLLTGRGPGTRGMEQTIRLR